MQVSWFGPVPNPKGIGGEDFGLCFLVELEPGRAHQSAHKTRDAHMQ